MPEYGEMNGKKGQPLLAKPCQSAIEAAGIESGEWK